MTKEEEELYDNKEVNKTVKNNIKKVREGSEISIDTIINKLDDELSSNFTKIDESSEEIEDGKLTYKIDRRKNESSVKSSIVNAMDSIKELCNGINQDYLIDMKAGTVYIELSTKA